MKYIQSFTEFEHTIPCKEKEFLIPKRSYTETEMQAGKRNILAIEDPDLKELKANKIVNALLSKKKGGIKILDSLPEKYRLHSEVIKDKEKALKNEQMKTAESQKENEKLKQENEDLKKQIEELKKDNKGNK